MSRPAKRKQETVESNVVAEDLAHEGSGFGSGAPQLRRFGCMLPQRAMPDLSKYN